MTSLNDLLEAAKAVEDDKEIISPYKRKRHSRHRRDIERTQGGSRETHNILEKNRRAELKNFFSKLKEMVPILQNRPKASNVSVLTEAMKYIQELNEIHKQNTNEMTRLRRCRMCLEERIKMLKEELDRQSINHVPNQKETESIKKTLNIANSGKQMVSIEIQANEQDIRDAYEENSKVSPLADKNTNNFAEENLTLESEEIPSLLGAENSSKDVLLVLKDKLLKRKRAHEMSNCDEESDSDNDLKIVCEELCA